MEFHLGEIPVKVTFKDIKNVHLSVYPPSGQVRISAPSRMDLDTVRVFALSKLKWIKDQRRKFNDQPRETQREMLERESHYVWGKRYLMEIHEACGRSGVSLTHKGMNLAVPPGSAPEKKLAILDEFYRQTLRRTASELVAKWEARLNLSANKVFIQKMKTKWGSCNAIARNIRLNLELAKKPPECLDYIILHELLHFLVPNHGEQFVALMDFHMPHWRVVRKALNDAPLSHVRWTDNP